MNVARYQLVKHTLEEVQFRCSSKGSMDDARRIATASKKFQKVKEPECWLLSYQVKFGSPTDPDMAPYNGLIRISADFVIDPELGKEGSIAILDTKGIKIAYGIIREYLASLTARSLHGVLLLPDMDFSAPTPPLKGNKPKR